MAILVERQEITILIIKKYLRRIKQNAQYADHKSLYCAFLFRQKRITQGLSILRPLPLLQYNLNYGNAVHNQYHTQQQTHRVSQIQSTQQAHQLHV